MAMVGWGLMNAVALRGIASVFAILVYGWVNYLLDPVATLLTGTVAGQQFDNSAVSYLSASWGMRLFGHLGIPAVVLVAVLAVIWWKQLTRVWARLFPAVLVVACVVLPATAARAYYDKADYTEAYFILPNESAFFIPDVGANRDTQAKFGSMEYLEANKVAAKRFIIPHAKFSGSGSWSDFYVPAGRLIVVDRTPYNREWVAAHDRGTSTRNEAFPCQSQEGINITAEVAIATSVSEENASRFLYFFGVKPPVGDRSNPAVIFTSVYSGKSLAEVMDSVGRGKVQALVCHEIGSRTFDGVNKDINLIMDAVEKKAGDYFIAKGITLDYIGWAGTLTFDKDVQQAVNDRYTAEKIAPVLPTLQTKALLDATARWNGQLPNNVSGLWLLPSDLWNSALNWLKPEGANKK
jgi:cytochrome c oxidase subunit IV